MGRDARKKRKKAMGEGWARKTGEKRGRRSGRKAPCGDRRAESATRKLLAQGEYLNC